MKRILLLTALIIVAQSIVAQNININIEGIRNKKGVIRIAVFQSEEQFRKDTPVLAKVVNKNDILNGCLKVNINTLQAGNYGIAVLDDENNNGKLDFRLFLPDEGYGFSNYVHRFLSRPKYKNFCFALGKGTSELTVKMKY